MKKLLSLLLIGLLLILLESFKSQTTSINNQDYTTLQNNEVVTLSPVISGKDLYVKKGCNLCHHPEKEVVGPSFKHVAETYKGNKEDLLKFLNGEAQPIVNPKEFSFMKSVLIQLKRMKPEEREALADFILSSKQP